MPNVAIITFNAYYKKLTNLLSKAFETSNETIPCITGNNRTSYAQFFKICS